MRLFVADPGKETGWVIVDAVPGHAELSYGGELSYEMFVDWVTPDRERTFFSVWGIDHVICEGFKVTAKTYQTCPTQNELWSVKVHGILEMYCRWASVPFTTQMPSAMKFDEYGAKLKKIGWWDSAPGVQGEAGHRRAAAKHALKFLVDHRLIDLRTLL
jgi:hypothetical protein